MVKNRDAEIRSFEFSDLQSSHVVSNGGFQPFTFGEINKTPFNKEKTSEDQLRQERSFEENTSFRIDDVVRQSRGLSRQEQNDLQTKIEAEVQIRLKKAYEEAYQEGLKQGQEAGKAEAAAHFEEELQAKLTELKQTISDLQAQCQTQVTNNRQEIYEFVKRFSKWIILKEIDPKVYLDQLLEKLILELNARKNLIIKVGREFSPEMPEIIKAVESRIGTLQNVRVEIVPELKRPGIILESENGLIDGSLEGVFQNIDKIFEQVITHE